MTEQNFRLMPNDSVKVSLDWGDLQTSILLGKISANQNMNDPFYIHAKVPPLGTNRQQRKQARMYESGLCTCFAHLLYLDYEQSSKSHKPERNLNLLNPNDQMTRKVHSPSLAMVSLLLLGSLQISWTAEHQATFSRDISPVLSKKCFQCHGPDQEHR